MTNLIQVTPFLHVADLHRALDFFTDIRDFTVPHRQPGSPWTLVPLAGALARFQGQDLSKE